MRKLTKREKDIVKKLNRPPYTVEYLEEWLDTDDETVANPTVALTIAYIEGFYDAVQAIDKQNLM